MRTTLNIVVGLIALSVFIYSFINPDGRNTIFGFAVNVWVYRAFWGIIACLGLKDAYDHFIKKGQN